MQSLPATDVKKLPEVIVELCKLHLKKGLTSVLGFGWTFLYSPLWHLNVSLRLNKGVFFYIHIVIILAKHSAAVWLHLTIRQRSSHMYRSGPQTDLDCQLILAHRAAAVISSSCPTEICRRMLCSRWSTHLLQHTFKQPNWSLLPGTRRAAQYCGSKWLKKMNCFSESCGAREFPFPTWFRAIFTLLS